MCNFIPRLSQNGDTFNLFFSLWERLVLIQQPNLLQSTVKGHLHKREHEREQGGILLLQARER